MLPGPVAACNIKNPEQGDFKFRTMLGHWTTTLTSLVPLLLMPTLISVPVKKQPSSVQTYSHASVWKGPSA